MRSYLDSDSLARPLEPARVAPAARPVGRGSAAIAPYDFDRPDKLSRKDVRALRTLHETYGHVLGSSLSAYLRISAQVELARVEQASVEGYLAQVTEPSVTGLVRLRPLPGWAVLAVDVGVARALLDRMLGGVGRGGDAREQLTDLELSLVNPVLAMLLSGLREAWANVAALEPAVEETAVGPHLARSALGAEALLVLEFEVRLQDVAGTLHLGIPITALEPILDKLRVRQRSPVDGAQDTGLHAVLRERLEHVALLLRAELGHAVVTLRELSDLQPGDVIHLASQAGQELELFVGGEPEFRARPGVSGNRMAVQIVAPNRDGRS